MRLNFAKMRKIIAFVTIMVFGQLNNLQAQTYKLTHFMLTVNSKPQAYDGPSLVIGDTFLSNINEVKNGDSTEIKVEKEADFFSGTSGRNRYKKILGVN